jgi:CheY-like chemotaxis protein
MALSEIILKNQLLNRLSRLSDFSFGANCGLLSVPAAPAVACGSIRKDADVCTVLPVYQYQTPAGKSVRGQGTHGSEVCSTAEIDGKSKGWILLVDDDASVRETLAELLEVGGFSTVQAVNAAGALAILRLGSAIDILVTDLTMPGDDGIALIRQAREIRRNLPAVLLTGYAEEVATTATIAGGSFQVLRKPVESDHLVEQLALLMADANT